MREDQLIEIVAAAIGQEQAQKAVTALVEHLGGSRIDIPTGDAQQRSRRNEDIRRLYRAGMHFASLAERFLLSEKQIRRIVGS